MDQKHEIIPFAVYTTEEAAELLSLSVVTIQKYIRENKIKATKIGDKWYRISGHALLEFMGLNNLDVPAVNLERALIALNKTQGTPIISVFENTAGPIKDITLHSNSSAELLSNLAKFITHQVQDNPIMGGRSNPTDSQPLAEIIDETVKTEVDR